MPSAVVVVSPRVGVEMAELVSHVKRAISIHLSTRRKTLTPGQISVRVVVDETAAGSRISELEVEVLAHLYLLRTWRLDQRARAIASDLMAYTGVECSCWINLCWVGYAESRVREGRPEGGPTVTADGNERANEVGR